MASFGPVLVAAGLEDTDIAAAARLRDRALSSPLAYELVTSLTTDVGPRLAGTPGDAAAVAWAVRELSRLGLENVREQPVIVPRWVRGEASFELVDPVAQPLPTVALGGSLGTTDAGILAQVAFARDLDALRSMSRDEVAGRIVYLGGRTERRQDARGYRSTVAQRATGPSVAASLGAVGLVIRSIGTSTNRLPHTGSIRYAIDAPRIPAVSLANSDADLIERVLARGAPVTARLRVTARDLPQVRSANVIAELPGSTRADEIVLLGAHLDSWDLGTGALDDGAGVAIVMAAARLLRDAKLAPRRTIRVVLYANEEFGLSGANAYAQAEGDALERHALAMEADLGAGPVWRLDSRVAEAQRPVVEAMAGVLSPLGVALGPNDAQGGADIQVLRRAGVPVLDPRLDANAYFDDHHTANDTLDKVDANAIRQSVATYAVAAWLAAQADVTFERLPSAPPPQ
jgi:hypothetical protein